MKNGIVDIVSDEKGGMGVANEIADKGDIG